MDRLLNLNTLTLAPTVSGPTPTMDAALKGKIHVRTKQMGKRWLTTIEGLDDDLDLVRIARALKKTLHCAASVERDMETDMEVIQLQGNQREFVRDWLVENEVITEKEAKERIVVHGV